MAFIQTWDETFPSDTQLASMGADDIRRLTYAVRERDAVDHYRLAIEAADPKIGYHKFATLIDQAGDPLGVPNATRLYSKTIDGKIELFLVFSDNTVVQLTSNGGKTLIENLYIAGAVAGDMIYYDGAKWTRIAWAALLALLNAQITFPYLTGQVIQEVYSQSGSLVACNTVIPLDDTIPQNTEGDQVLNVTITPSSATNILKVEVVVFIGANADISCCMALFKDADVNALMASAGYNVSSGEEVMTIVYHMVAGGVAPIEFKVRAGSAGSGNLTFNGRAGSRKFGGVAGSSITVSEIKG